MNKNHFVYGYFGNKRQETDTILKNIDLAGVKTIIEPFCGSSAFSYKVSLHHPKKFNYVLNDNDKFLIELYNILKDEEETLKLETELNEVCKNIKNKDDYLKEIKKDNLIGYLVARKIHKIKYGLYNLNYKYNKYIKLDDKPIIKFLRTENIIFSAEDAIDVFKRYRDDPSALIFCDPPYIKRDNTFYSNHNLNIYEFVKNNEIFKNPSKIIFVVEENKKINEIFYGFEKISYGKKYDTTQTKTTHLIIKNNLILN